MNELGLVENVRDLQKVFGFFNYFREHNAEFCKTGTPLYAKLKGKNDSKV